MANVKWNSEMDVFIKKCDPKISFQKISEMMNEKFGLEITKNSVIGRAHRLNITKPVKKKTKPVAKKKLLAESKPKKELVKDSNVKETIKPAPTTLGEIEAYRQDFPNPEARRLTFKQITMGKCHYPLGDYKKGTLRYCGADVDQSKQYPYCAICYKIIYIPATKWQRNKVDELSRKQ